MHARRSKRKNLVGCNKNVGAFARNPKNEEMGRDLKGH
jgi:hypothetical protein